MDPRLARPESKSSRADVAVLLAKGKLIGCLTTSSSKRSHLDASDINRFHDVLQAALLDSTHTSREFKKCVAWVVCHTAKSRRRVSALGEYLVKLSESYHPSEDTGTVTSPDPIFSRARISLLHLLHATAIRIRQNPGNLLRKPLETYTTFAKAVEPIVVRLVELAAPTSGRDQSFHLHQALSRLLAHWDQERLFTKRIRLNIRNVVREAYIQWLDWLRQTDPSRYDKLVITIPAGQLYAELPSTHGSLDDAWYDLPVGAMVPVLKTTKPGHPLQTSQLKPLDMPRGPADPDMMAAVLEHVEDCKNIIAIPNLSSTEDQEDFILNGVGLRVTRNEGDKRSFKLKQGYYGFNVPFMRVYEKIDKSPPVGPERPANWIPPPPPQYNPQSFGGPPPFMPQNLPPQPPMRDAAYQGHSMNGGGYPSRGNGGGWRGSGESRGGSGSGNWRGPPRGRGGGGGRGWGAGYRPY